MSFLNYQRARLASAPSSMESPSPSLRKRGGFTLLELAVSMAILGVVVGGLVMAVRGSNSAFQYENSRGSLAQNSHRIVSRMASYLASSGTGTFAPAPVGPLGSQTLDFRRCTGSAGGVPVFGPLERFTMQLDASEAADGIDNDGDGLVDENDLVWIENPGDADARTSIWATGLSPFLAGETDNDADDNGNGLVDEAGLSFVLEGELLTLRMTMQASIQGQLTQRTVETSIRIQN